MTKDHYLSIRDKYGLHASWAVWAPQGDAPKSNIGDLSLLDPEQNPKLLSPLKPEILLVGLNMARVSDHPEQLYRNFHDTDPSANDFKLRYAFTGTNLWGAYMTDVIKGYRTPNSGDVKAKIKSDPDFLKQNIESFRDEVTFLQAPNPILIAMGNDAYRILQDHFQVEYRIYKVPHYSQQFGKLVSAENYRQAVFEKLNGLIAEVGAR